MHKKIYFLVAFLWTIVIVVLSLISFSKAPKVFSEFARYDKLGHFVFYFVFVFLWGNYVFHNRQTRNRTLFFLFCTALILGGIMELFQELFTERRTADIFDMLANLVGALAGIGVLYLYKKRIWTSKNI